ncbi:hypothetical protein OVY01_20930 [Robbsia sp. Bb-Pol-6]|uniref:Uncharacterized protein n=1 Tax=Robbsia betulipollinis TaxID=2981849 RepID=A0ABT3ZUP5_9BURK|nr:hypothetical protein [Robbsia betulipollinis]MCY0389615.1 hypothetical protein [Robbsia betulipollinis]
MSFSPALKGMLIITATLFALVCGLVWLAGVTVGIAFALLTPSAVTVAIRWGATRC